MLRKRLIAVIFLKGGHIVRSQSFEEFQIIGDHMNQLQRFNEWNLDELVYIDITRSDELAFLRSDKKVRQMPSLFESIESISASAFMPLTVGGNIKDLHTAISLINRGADKILINTMAHKHETLITDLAKITGSQAVVVGIDTKYVGGQLRCFVSGGKELLEQNPVDLAIRAEALGAGELFVNSIDRDGTADGYDLKGLGMIANAVKIPVVACGGCGYFRHFIECMRKNEVDAVAAGNIFHFTENSYRRAKKFLLSNGMNVRPS